MSLPTLVTIPPSHYCDKARWALERAGIAYREEGHVPILHYAFVYPRTRTRTVPVLLIPGRQPLVESTEILRFADASLDEPRRLFPSDPELLRRVLAWVERFDRELGPPVRRHVYCFLVHDRRAFLEAFTGPLGPVERFVAIRGEAVFRAMLARAFRVSPRAAERTRKEVLAIFDEVSAELADGRQYLVGDRFTAADLTFAALAQLLLLPPFPDALLPAGLLETIEALRATPAGKLGVRLLTERRDAARAG